MHGTREQQKHRTAKLMDDDIIECMKFAKEKQDVSCLSKVTRVKRDNDKAKESIGVLEQEVIELEENKIKIEINGYIKVCAKQSGRLQLLPAIES